MITISASQMVQLRQGVMSNFESDMLAHMRQFFPNHWRVVGPQALRQVVQLAVVKAGRHGWVSQREVCLYLSVMLYLGSHFDSDPQLPWAARVLARAADGCSPAAVITTLYDTTLDYLDQTYGGRNEHLGLALSRIGLLLKGEALAASRVHSADDVLAGLHWVLPTKSQAAGAAGMQALARECGIALHHWRLATPRGAALLMGLMFMLGHGVAEDPQFPWVRAGLQAAQDGLPEARVERLAALARQQFAAWRE